VRDFQDTYSNYLAYREEDREQRALLRRESQEIVRENKGALKDPLPPPAVVKTATTSSPLKKGVNEEMGGEGSRSSGPKLSYEERKEVGRLEREIEKAEAQLREVRGWMQESSGKVGYSVLAEWSARETELVELIEEKEMRWLELVDGAGGS